MKPTAPTPIQPNPAAAILLTGAAIQSLDRQIAELQTKLDELPAQETAIAEDRTKAPAEVRAGLAALQDRASDLKFAQKRLAGDRANTLSGAVALFPQCVQLVANHFSARYETEKQKALTALAPFFEGSTDSPTQALDYLPSLKLAATHAAWCLERVKGENPEDTLGKYVAVIQEFQLHINPAQTSAS